MFLLKLLSLDERPLVVAIQTKLEKSKGSKWEKIPIFVVSNTASSTNIQSYIHLGVSKYCVKAEHRLDGIVKDLKSFLDNPED